MIPLPPQRFLNRLRVPADRGEVLRAERLIATGRAFLSIASFIAIYLDPTEPSQYAQLAYASLLLYALHSFAVLIVLYIRQETAPQFSLILHGVDILWPAYITLFTEGPNSPFFAFFIFVLLAAAYRWGLKETLVTAGLAVAIIFIESSLIVAGPWQLGSFMEGRFELNRLIIRSSYLMMLAFLAGYLAEGEKQLRAETSVIARVLGKARVEIGLRGTLQAVLEEFLQVFEARQALLVLEETGTSELFLWKAERDPKTGQTALHLSEIGPMRRQMYFFSVPAVASVPADAWHLLCRNRSEGNSSFSLLALDDQGKQVRNADLILPESFPQSHPFSRALLVLSFQIRGEWSGRLFLLDPALGFSRREELQFSRTLLNRALPAIYNVYLLRRLRAQASLIERARVARELHDGVMQTLSVAVMRMGLLRHPKFNLPANLEEEVSSLQDLLRKEMINLRELMEAMKPLDLHPGQLLDFLSDLTEKFRHESGINARFLCSVEEVTLRPRVCREVGRIVQEALFNVRKHSGAQNVIVSLHSQNGQWMLIIDDDGRGFPFSGRLSQAELDAARRGPVVIKERVRSLGGELAVDSKPGRGARLEITIPEQTSAEKI